MREFAGYVHGVNLGGWLSQCDHTQERYDNFIKEEDIAKIKSWGLDHVRVPVDYNLVEDAEGNYLEGGFARLQKTIDWCGKYGLNMVLDLHKTFGFSFDVGEQEFGFFENKDYQERFYRLWEEFARRYGNIGDRVCFELLNEVTAREYSDLWNEISTICIKRIRAIAPNVYILLGGYFNNSIEALKDLAAPVDDRVVYNFHCYEPLVYTHQGAPWVEGMDPDFRMPLETTYGEYKTLSGTQLNIYGDLESLIFNDFDLSKTIGVEYFEKYLQEAIRVAEERNVPLYCGEYGVIDRCTPEDTLKWYKLMAECYNRHKIGRAAWSYKEMDFGLTDPNLDGVREEILKNL